MRSLALLAALAALSIPQNAHGRAFWQTYGATVPSPSGCGCAWNVNSDYFVPRYCDSCRYGLYGACKTAHSLSPACRNLHPIYGGYCTPFGPGHYKMKDHVYAKKCGCTPLACTYGPWHLDKCDKHCRRLPAMGASCGACGCGAGATMGCEGSCPSCYGGVAMWGYELGIAGELPNVEPLGGEVLGVIQAFPARMGGASMGGMGMPNAMPAAMPSAPAAAPTGPLPMPGMFGT